MKDFIDVWFILSVYQSIFHLSNHNASSLVTIIIFKL